MSSVELDRDEMLQLLDAFHSESLLFECMAKLQLQPDSVPFCDAVAECLSDGVDHHLSCLQYAQQLNLSSLPWLLSWDSRCRYLNRHIKKLLPWFAQKSIFIDNPYCFGPGSECHVKWHPDPPDENGRPKRRIKEFLVRGLAVSTARLDSARQVLADVQILALDGLSTGPTAPLQFQLTQPGRAAADLQHLQQLSLRSNALTGIPRELLTDLPLLRKLDLSNNCFTRFPQFEPPAAASDSPSSAVDVCYVKILILAGNKLTRVISSATAVGSATRDASEPQADVDPSGNTLSIDFAQLQVLNLSGNKIERLTVPRSLVGLTSLNVADNHIEHIDGASIVAAISKSGTDGATKCLQQLVIKGNQRLSFPPSNISEATGSDVVNFYSQV